jgi:glycyl-tRNA synthetase beta chain
VKKIIAKVKEQYSVDPSLFQQEEEKKLYQQLVELEKQLENLPIEEQIKALSQFKETIDQFFDNVMVMAKEENIKRNRIALLQRVKKLFERVADLEKLPL